MRGVRLLYLISCLAVFFASSAAHAKTGVASLDAVAAAIAALPADPVRQDLAVHVSGEGHWTLVNRAGDPFTAARIDELRRGLDTLMPNDAANPTKALNLYLTPESVFDRRGHLSALLALPRNAITWLAGTPTQRLVAVGSGASAVWYVEVMPNVFVTVGERATFEETMRLLSRRLDRAGMRQLTLEPSGPETLPAKPKVDRATGRIAADSIDPNKLPQAVAALSGQTIVLVGRIDGDKLFYRPPSGPERAMDLAALAGAAARADVNLLLIRSPNGQQPGSRTWLWQRVEVKGLDNALTHATLGDFLAALGGPSNRMALDAVQGADGRLRLDLHRASGLPSTQSGAAQMSGALADLVSGLAGKVVHDGAILDARSNARQVELDRRLIPFLPADVTWGYAALLVLGLIGLPVARDWWRRIWPLEKPADYRNAFGYWTAAFVRGLVFLFVFLPFSAVLAGPAALLRLLSGRRKVAS